MSLLDRLPLWFQTTIAAMVVLVVLAISSLTGASASPSKMPNIASSGAACTASGATTGASVSQEYAHEVALGAGSVGGAKAPNETYLAAERSYFPAYAYAEKVANIGSVVRCGGGPRAPPALIQ